MGTSVIPLKEFDQEMASTKWGMPGVPPRRVADALDAIEFQAYLQRRRLQ